MCLPYSKAAGVYRQYGEKQTVQQDPEAAKAADLSPMSVGALTQGVYLRELVASYQPFGNGGKYFAPTSYTYVLDPSGETILQHSYTPIQSISEESAYVMNKLMQQVIEGPNGTGKAAKLNNVPVVGKTGTSQEWRDNLFIGCGCKRMVRERGI